MTARLDPRMHAYDNQNRHAGFVYVLMVVVALAFGGFLWQLYSTPETPRITAPSSPYRVEPPIADPNAGELSAPAELAPEAPPADLATGSQAEDTSASAGEAETVAGPPQLSPAPTFTAGGGYVAQLAALQNEAGAQLAFERLASRAPGLFASATLDVERADLGPRGVYYRVRAGYFADRTNAARFCERIRQMGQDCIAVAR